MKKTSKRITSLLFLSAMAVILTIGGIFSHFALSWIYMSAAIVICVVFYAWIERSGTTSLDISSAAVMTALAVLGRIAFAAIPAFKPCQAIIIISGIFLGARQGFTVGSLTALISNFYFSQGIWTPFQMVIWGLTGFLGGILAKPLKSNRVLLMVFGVISGVIYSLFMDFWSVIWADNAFTAEKFLGLTLTSLWFTVGYVTANVVFLLSFMPAAERIFSRLHRKFGKE